MTVRTVAYRCQLAKFVEQQLVPWETLYWLRSCSSQQVVIPSSRPLLQHQEMLTLISKSLTVSALRLFASRLWTGLIAYASVSIALSYSGLLLVLVTKW